MAVKRLPLLLLSAGLLAACGTQSSSASSPTAGNASVVRLQPANAGSDVSDLGRANPAVRKGPAGPIVPAPVQPQPGVAATTGSTSGDRCSSGFHSGTGLSPRSGVSAGKQPPLPMCAPQ